MSLDTQDNKQIVGLTEAEVANQRRLFGYNEIPALTHKSGWKILISVLMEPMFLILLAGCFVYIFMDDWYEALALFIAVIFVIGITFVQERRTERALEALKNLSSPRALVWRNGQLVRIAGREVVPGDLVVLNAGDRVPADGNLLESSNLFIDESLLTGESRPVHKIISVVKPAAGQVFSGSLIISGTGLAKVSATGIHTTVGKIGQRLQDIEPESTRVQKEVRHIVKWLAIMATMTASAVVVLYGVIRADWWTGTLGGITLGMSTIPEEFPVVLTVFLALGAWRISRGQVLTRRIPAVEALGSITALCVDKTGTLTLNKLAVADLCTPSQSLTIKDKVKIPLEYSVLLENGLRACAKQSFDQLDIALDNFAGQHPEVRMQKYEKKLIKEYPLTDDLFAISRVFAATSDTSKEISAKGAPEAIWELCHLSAADKDKYRRLLEKLATQGRRVIAVARAKYDKPSLPASPRDFPFEFLGLIGFVDPIRPGVKEATQICYRAGIRIIVLTGDYPGTAQSIAREIGLHNPNNFILGKDLANMSDVELASKVKQTNIFARIVPEQKLRLVRILQKQKEIIAMTGDGVNDAPALRAAEIGIAMGRAGTDVAREAAALILLDDNFTSIVQAIRQGRSIFDNLRKAMLYLIAVHLPIVGLAVVPLLWGWPLLLLPIQAAFLELIIDPACSLAFERQSPDRNLMLRPPRPITEPALTGSLVLGSCLQGLGILGFIIMSLWLGERLGLEVNILRSLAFSLLVLSNLVLILAGRTWQFTFGKHLRPEPVLLTILGGAIFFWSLIVFLPVSRTFFQFGELNLLSVQIIAGALLGIGLWLGVLKLIFEQKQKLSK